MSSASPPPSDEFKAGLDQLQTLVKRTRGLVEQQQQLEAQKHENEMVAEELAGVADGDAVYKLAARVLVKQDVADAKATVAARIKLIVSEAAKTETAIKKAMGEQDELRAKLSALQRAQQQQQLQQRGAE